MILWYQIYNTNLFLHINEKYLFLECNNLIIYPKAQIYIWYRVFDAVISSKDNKPSAK